MKFTKGSGLLAIFIGLMVIASPAFAGGSPHFIKKATTVSLNGTSLYVKFKEAGLSAGAVENITLHATIAVTYESVNGGGKNPAASNKHTYVVSGSTSGNFAADKNGNVVGSLTLSPPSAADVGFSSPPGQTTVLVSAVYSNIVLTDNTSGATISLPGTFTYTNPSAPPVN